VKYDTLVEVIKRTNGVSDIDLLPVGSVLKILPGRRYPSKGSMGLEDNIALLKQRDAIKTMRMLVGMDVPKEEVEYYLKSHDWDVKAAMKERNDDLTWEKSHPNRGKKNKWF